MIRLLQLLVFRRINSRQFASCCVQEDKKAEKERLKKMEEEEKMREEELKEMSDKMRER